MRFQAFTGRTHPFSTSHQHGQDEKKLASVHMALSKWVPISVNVVTGWHQTLGLDVGEMVSFVRLTRLTLW